MHLFQTRRMNKVLYEGALAWDLLHYFWPKRYPFHITILSERIIPLLVVKKRGQKEYSRWKLNVSISSLSLCEHKPIKLWNKSAVNTPSIKRVPLSEEHDAVDRRLVTLRNIYKLKPLLCLLFSLADMPIYSVIGSILEGPGGILRYRSDGSARRTISRTPPKGTRILF